MSIAQDNAADARARIDSTLVEELRVQLTAAEAKISALEAHVARLTHARRAPGKILREYVDATDAVRKAREKLPKGGSLTMDTAVARRVVAMRRLAFAVSGVKLEGEG